MKQPSPTTLRRAFLAPLPPSPGPMVISQEEMPLRHYPLHRVSWVLLWGTLPSPCCLWQGKILLLLPWISVRAVEYS